MRSLPPIRGELRRIFTLKLATVREGEEPTRRRAARSEFTDEEWRLVNELADHPNRFLVTATSEAGETYAEVAHEAVFRRWDKLRDWIAAEREYSKSRACAKIMKRLSPDRCFILRRINALPRNCSFALGRRTKMTLL